MNKNMPHHTYVRLAIMVTMLASVVFVTMLSGCSSNRQVRLSTGSGAVATQSQASNNDVVWYLIWYHVIFGNRQDITNYYSNPSASWAQTQYRDNATYSEPEYEESAYEDSFWDNTYTPSTPSYDYEDTYTPSYNDSFWDTSGGSNYDIFWDSTPSFDSSDYGDSFFDGDSYGGSDYGSDFW